MLEKIPSTIFHENSSSGSHAVPFVQTDRLTVGHDEAISHFFNNRLGNAPEKKRETQII